MKRRSFAALLAVTPLMSSCFWDKYFDLAWEEEVQLHDGRVVVVNLRHTYERLQPGFTRYGGRTILRDTTITFDAGGTTGTVTQMFKGYQPKFLGQYDGVWYVTINGGDYNSSKNIPGQDWGLSWYDCSPAARLVGSKFVPISIHDLPTVFDKPNMLLLYGAATEHAAFNGTRVTLADKVAWLTKHPPGFGDDAICRPPRNARRPENIFQDDRTQGAKK